MQEITNARIAYTLTMEDVIAFNLFHFRHSLTIRKTQQRALIIYSLLTFCSVLGMALLRETEFWPSLFVVLATTSWTAGYMLYYQKRGYIKRARKIVQQMTAENKQPSLLGEHTLEVDANGITHASAYSQTRYAWGALERIETEPGYTYLYMGAQTFILRHEAIESSDFKAFLEQIARFHSPQSALLMEHGSQIKNISVEP